MSHQDNARWIATVTYRSELGPFNVDHYFEELYELHELIEHGPDWNAIVCINLILNPRQATRPGMTVENGATGTIANWTEAYRRFVSSFADPH